MLRPFFALFLGCATLLSQDPSLDSLRKDGHWKQLRPRIEGWYRSNPEDPYALLWMSRLKQAFSDPEGALELARKAAAAKPTDPDIQAQLGTAAGQCAGQAEGKLKQLSLARELKKALEVALPAKLDDEQVPVMLLQFYLQAPGIVGGGEGKAKDLARRVKEVRTEAGLLLEADIAFHAKDPEKARTLIQQALAKDGKFYGAHLAMANYHLRLKPQALDAALVCYRQALAVKPAGIFAHAQIASILAEQGKWAELESSLAQARNAAPANLLPYYSAGRNLIAENKHLDHAEPLLRTYLTQEPEGNAPDRAAAHWRLGLLFEKLGRKADALKELEQALKLRSHFPQARKDLERMKKG